MTIGQTNHLDLVTISASIIAGVLANHTAPESLLALNEDQAYTSIIWPPEISVVIMEGSILNVQSRNHW